MTRARSRPATRRTPRVVGLAASTGLAVLSSCAGGAAIDAGPDPADAIGLADRPIPFDAPRCSPGTTNACACTTGEVGEQSCRSDGTYAACVCRATMEDSSVDALDASTADADEGCARRTCESLQATCGTYDDGCGGMVSCGPCTAIVRTFPSVEVTHIVFDPVRHLIYGTLPLTPTHGGTIAVIEPTTGDVVSTFTVGLGTNAIAISHDAARLYVGDGERRIIGIDLETRTPVEAAVLPANARAIAVLSDSPRTVLAVTHDDIECSAVVLENGVIRSRSSLFSGCPDGLALGPPGIVYGGVRSYYPGPGMYVVLSVGADVVATRFVSGPSDAAADPRPVVEDGRLFLGDGSGFTLETPAAPTFEDQLPRVGTLSVDPTRHRIYMLGRRRNEFSSLPIWGVYDATTYRPILEIETHASGVDLVRTGERTFAAAGGTLVFITSPLP